jgi:hypothetical protein
MILRSHSLKPRRAPPSGDYGRMRPLYRPGRGGKRVPRSNARPWPGGMTPPAWPAPCLCAAALPGVDRVASSGCWRSRPDGADADATGAGSGRTTPDQPGAGARARPSHHRLPRPLKRTAQSGTPRGPHLAAMQGKRIWTTLSRLVRDSPDPIPLAYVWL